MKCWGTRGSLPKSFDHEDALKFVSELVDYAKKSGVKTLDEFLSSVRDGGLGHPLSFGGATTCTEVGTDKHKFFVDMGSGFREAGSEAIEAGEKEFHVFLTHMHWDHIMGMPFFIPTYVPGSKIHIYHVHRNTPDAVAINFNGINFPLKWSDLKAEITFHQLKLYEKHHHDDVTVTPFVLDHPGGCFGYRFEANGKSLAIGVDGEYQRMTREELGKDLAFYQNLDLLLFDAQYELAELASRFDWGHCSPTVGVELALREGIRNIVFTHHDPWSTPAKIRSMFKVASDHLKSKLPQYEEVWKNRGQSGPNLFCAYDGFRIDLT